MDLIRRSKKVFSWQKGYISWLCNFLVKTYHLLLKASSYLLLITKDSKSCLKGLEHGFKTHVGSLTLYSLACEETDVNYI